MSLAFFAGSSTPNAPLFTALPLSANLRHLQTRQHHRIIVRGAKGQSYNVEIECDEDEDPEGVFKRFRNSCNQAGMVYEARKRQYFENTQDIKKRKQQERGMHKARAMRERYLTTYGDAHSDTPPFSDLFQGQDDIYDIIGNMSDSYDEDRSMFSRRQARNNNSNNGAASNSLSSSANIETEGSPASQPEPASAPEPAANPNLITRSVASDGPVATGGSNESEAKSKQRPKFETAKSRRAQAASRS